MTSSRTVRDFFSPCGKNLSPCGKFNDIYAKHKQKSAILAVWGTTYDKLFILCWRIYRTVRDFYRTVRDFYRTVRKKSLTVRELFKF
jgi:hypothetical protein